jgi:hypothetical protein
LDAHRIDYYETPAGRWGLSAPGLWVNDEAQQAQAKTLIAEYQRERAERVRHEYQTRRARGEAPTLWTLMKSQPLRFAGVLAAVAFIIYVSVGPFLKWGID